MMPNKLIEIVKAFNTESCAGCLTRCDNYNSPFLCEFKARSPVQTTGERGSTEG